MQLCWCKWMMKVPTLASKVQTCQVSSLWQSLINFLENNFVHLGSKNLPGPHSNFTINTAGHPIHTGFLPPFLASGAVQNALSLADVSSSRRLNPHSPHFPVEFLPATNSSRDFPDPDLLLEHQLECVLESIQKKLQTSSAEILSPGAQGILIAINTLVSSRGTPGSARTSSRTLSCWESPCSHSW